MIQRRPEEQQRLKAVCSVSSDEHRIFFRRFRSHLTEIKFRLQEFYSWRLCLVSVYGIEKVSPHCRVSGRMDFPPPSLKTLDQVPVSGLVVDLENFLSLFRVHFVLLLFCSPHKRSSFPFPPEMNIDHIKDTHLITLRDSQDPMPDFLQPE